MDYPLIVSAIALVTLWLSAKAGAYFPRISHSVEEVVREDLTVVLAAALTLLGLIIGFSFSMATTRYFQRKTMRRPKANAIGTEYLRAGLLPSDATIIRAILAQYLDQRILFYRVRNKRQLKSIDTSIARLQTDLWSRLEATVAAHPTPLMMLVISGMNDVLNSQGYTQAAWWNRIPTAAWALMEAVAICCNALLAYTSRCPGSSARRFLILPLIVTPFF